MLTLEDRQTLDAARRIRARERREAKAKRPAPVIPSAQGQRQPRVRDNGYLAWVRRLPCAAGADGCEGPVEAAHIRFSSALSGRRNPGLQCKPSDRHVMPLCVAHHRGGPLSQHSMNEVRFWSLHNIDPDKLIIALNECFDNNGDGAAVVYQFARSAISADPS